MSPDDLTYDDVRAISGGILGPPGETLQEWIARNAESVAVALIVDTGQADQ